MNTNQTTTTAKIQKFTCQCGCETLVGPSNRIFEFPPKEGEKEGEIVVLCDGGCAKISEVRAAHTRACAAHRQLMLEVARQQAVQRERERLVHGGHRNIPRPHHGNGKTARSGGKTAADRRRANKSKADFDLRTSMKSASGGGGQKGRR